MEIDERNIGFQYNTMRLMEFNKECIDTVVKIIYLLDKKGGGYIMKMIRNFLFLGQGISIHGGSRYFCIIVCSLGWHSMVIS